MWQKTGTNLGFTFIEITRGLWTNSIVILTGALQNSGDRASLGLAWFFDKFCQRAGAHRCELEGAERASGRTITRTNALDPVVWNRVYV